jgi:hypothetical protein
MRIPRKLQQVADTKIVQPVKNATAMALSALLLAILALIVAVAK